MNTFPALTFGIRQLIGILFPKNDYFSHPWHSLVVSSSLCRRDVSWSFLCVCFANVCCCCLIQVVFRQSGRWDFMDILSDITRRHNPTASSLILGLLPLQFSDPCCTMILDSLGCRLDISVVLTPHQESFLLLQTKAITEKCSQSKCWVTF